MNRMLLPRLTLLLGLGLGCSGCASTSAPQASQPSDEPDAQVLAQRVQRATLRRDLILQAAQTEDAPRKGKAKQRRVAEQLTAQAQRAESVQPRTPFEEAGVRAFEEACGELEAAYLASELESTDPGSHDAPWSVDERRDTLGSRTVDGKLRAWQEEDAKHPFVKFAVVRAPDASRLLVRVGPFDLGHVDIAGGPALSAGLLQTRVIDGKTFVVVFENTSGGFRPGPLRNQTTRRALDVAGYLPPIAADLTVYDNPSGGYADSQLVR